MGLDQRLWWELKFDDDVNHFPIQNVLNTECQDVRET